MGRRAVAFAPFTVLTLCVAALAFGAERPGVAGAPSQAREQAPARHIVVPAGEPIPAVAGVWFVEPRSGAAEGWEFALDEPYPRWLVSPRGRFIAWSERPVEPSGPPRWRLLDTAGPTARDLPGRPLFSPDDARFVVASDEGLLLFGDADGAAPRLLRAGPVLLDVRPGSSVWAPDGRSLLAVPLPPSDAATRPAILLRLDADTGAATEIPSGSPVRSAGWSPDGARYFTRGDDGRIRAFDAGTDGGVWSVGADDLPDLPGLPRDVKSHGKLETPVVSRDGRLGAIVSRFYDSTGPGLNVVFDVFVIDPADGATRFWVEGAWRCGPHLWSADGRWLLVNDRVGDIYGTYLVAADGSELRYLGEHVQDLSPVDAGIGATPGYPDPALLRVVSIPDGGTERALRASGPVRWWFEDRLWLDDGRLVLTAPPIPGGGCAEGGGDERELAIRFP